MRILTLHEGDGRVGLLAGAGLAHLVDRLDHEGVHGVGRQARDPHPRQGAVGAHRPHARSLELRRVVLGDHLGGHRHHVIRDLARRVRAGPRLAPRQRHRPGVEPGHQGARRGVRRRCGGHGGSSMAITAIETWKLTHNVELDDVLALDLVVDEAVVLPGVLQPHPGHREVEGVLAEAVARVPLAARPPPPGELHQGLLGLVPARAVAAAPPLQQQHVRVLRHVADNIIMYNSVVGNMPSNIAKQYKLSLSLYD